MQTTFLILHDIRSAHNVGAIMRTADAIGVSKIYLTGYTPSPTDRFGRAQKDVLKTALGAEKSVPWESRENVMSLIEELKAQHMRIVSVELHPRAIDYKKFELQGPSVLIFGNEVEGISEDIIERSHDVVALPMRGEKESLNVSVAAGIVLFRLLDR